MATTFDIQLPHYSRGFHLITRDIVSHLPELPENGLLVVFIKHTSAGITINENADPDVVHDMLCGFEKVFPAEQFFYQHAEGNSHAHMKTTVVGPSQTLIIHDGEIVFGIWQDLYFCEFDGPRNRTFYVKIIEG